MLTYSRTPILTAKSREAIKPRKNKNVTTEVIKPTDFQQKILDCEVDLVLPGGRGGGKSVGVALKVAQMVDRCGENYQGLYIRKTYKGITDFEKICRKVFRSTNPKASYNKTEKLWTFPNGATIELGQLEHESDYEKYQGRSFTQIIIDEATQYTSPALLDLLLSNIRGPIGTPTSRIIVANPGNTGHGWALSRYVKDRINGEQYYEPETERQVITINSTYRDNPKIDGDKYVALLRSATANDEELRKAYVDGDWNIARGAFFSTVLDKTRSSIPAWRSIPVGWTPFIGMDYGTAAPCPIYLAAVSPGSTVDGKYYPVDSIVLIDELYLANKATGLSLTIDQAAERIKTFCRSWNFDPMSLDNIADDACFSTDGRESIANLFLESGVRFAPARKGDRISGWEHLRTMLRCAGDADHSGLYVSELCQNFWLTMPFVPRSTKNLSDVDTQSDDHIADAVRYICLVTRREKAQEFYLSSYGMV
jgi:hypothetical protein